MSSQRESSDSLTADSKARLPAEALHRLFLTLFLRGHSARGLQKGGAPRSIATKLAMTLAFYALIGLLAFAFRSRGVFTLSVYLHGLTFAFLGMFVASSAGEILFNKEEADILLHRPIDPKMMLWAKVRVLVAVSLWLAFVFNLAGFFVGIDAPNGGWWFPFVHAFSIVLEALFCTSTVIVVYQLCLHWCGRERLENLMTSAQVAVAVGAVLAGQLVPQMMIRVDGQLLDERDLSWWIAAMPPAWFAGIDDALVAGFRLRSVLLAIMALAATGAMTWFALERLARDYATGLQLMNETSSKRTSRPGRRPLAVLVNRPPLRWLLRDPVTRASFLLTIAYLLRDRDVKLRVYPGLAPVLVLPIVMLLPMRNNPDTSGFAVALCGAYFGLAPMLAIVMLQFSQQWQAGYVFRAAPMAGPAAICAGARQAIFWFLAVPTLIAVGSLVVAISGRVSELPLLLPGALALPIYLLIPSISGRGVPLSQPVDEAKATSRGLSVAGITILSMALAVVANLCWWAGLFWLLIALETITVVALYWALRSWVSRARWISYE